MHAPRLGSVVYAGGRRCRHGNRIGSEATLGAQALHSGRVALGRCLALCVPCYLRSGNRSLMGPEAGEALAGAQCTISPRKSRAPRPSPVPGQRTGSAPSAGDGSDPRGPSQTRPGTSGQLPPPARAEWTQGRKGLGARSGSWHVLSQRGHLWGLPRGQHDPRPKSSPRHRAGLVRAVPRSCLRERTPHPPRAPARKGLR